MTIVLHNGKDAFHISRVEWGRLLELGRNCGWQPAGTVPPEWDDPHMQPAYADRNGVYTSVTDADARALTAALAGAFPDLPDPVASPSGTGLAFDQALPGAEPPEANRRHLNSNPDPNAGLAGEHKARVVQFVAFAQQGGFSILSGPSLRIGAP